MNLDAYLQHFGVLGMKWGVRRYRNKDGTLTNAGKKHYAKTGEEGYHYKSNRTKRLEKKATRLENSQDSKAQKYREQADRAKELDRRKQEYAESVSVGRHIVRKFWSAGLWGSKSHMDILAVQGNVTKVGEDEAAFVLYRHSPLVTRRRMVKDYIKRGRA